MNPLPCARRSHPMDLARQTRCHVEDRSRESQSPDVLGLGRVVNRRPARLDPINLGARRRRGVNRSVLADGQRCHSSRAESGVNLPGGPISIPCRRFRSRRSTAPSDCRAAAKTASEIPDVLGVSRQAQQPFGRDRDTPGLAAGKLSGGIADPDLGRRARSGRAQRRHPEHDENEEARSFRALYQMRGETSIVSRTDPLTGIGSSTDSDCNLR